MVECTCAGASWSPFLWSGLNQNNTLCSNRTNYSVHNLANNSYYIIIIIKTYYKDLNYHNDLCFEAIFKKTFLSPSAELAIINFLCRGHHSRKMINHQDHSLQQKMAISIMQKKMAGLTSTVLSKSVLCGKMRFR